jgi:hypothetical protein
VTSLSREVRVPLAWQWIERVREATAEATASCPPDVREGAIMVASELAENLVKYGTGLHGDDSGTVTIDVAADAVTIRSVNGATPEQAEKVQALIADTQGDDPARLYMERLVELARRPGEVACELGLLRIAFEGGFTLSAEYASPRLVLSATRTLG